MLSYLFLKLGTIENKVPISVDPLLEYLVITPPGPFKICRSQSKQYEPDI